MKIKLKIIFTLILISLSALSYAQSSGVPIEIQNYLIGRWVPDERICLNSAFDKFGNFFQKKDKNQLQGDQIANLDEKKLDPVLTRKFVFTSGKIISENIYEVSGTQENVIDKKKYKLIQTIQVINNNQRITTKLILDDKIFVSDGRDLEKNQDVKPLIKCESPVLHTKNDAQSSAKTNCTSLSDVNDIHECQKRQNPNSYVDLHLSPLMKQCESMSKTLKEKRGITIFGSKDWTMIDNNCHSGCSSSDKCAEIIIDRIKDFYGSRGSNECLDTGKLPICALKTSHPTYVCGREFGYDIMTGGQGMVNRMCKDNSKLNVQFQMKNNLPSSIKDVTFRCESIAASGTVIGSREVQVFEIWQAGEVRSALITIPHINQTSSLKCIAKSWK